MGNQLTVNIALRSEDDSCQSLDLNIECKQDINLAIEFLERLYKKSTEAKVPRETVIAGIGMTDAQRDALNMITPIG